VAEATFGTNRCNYIVLDLQVLDVIGARELEAPQAVHLALHAGQCEAPLGGVGAGHDEAATLDVGVVGRLVRGSDGEFGLEVE
jgi:hypothetical protein